MQDRTIIGLTEEVVLHGNETADITIRARIDTGATKSSIDKELAQKLKLHSNNKTKIVKSAHGTTVRPLVEGSIELAHQTIDVHFTVADRSHLKYSVLIGQDALRAGNFLIDPQKK